MQNVDFKFDYDSYGWANINIDVDGKHYEFMPSFLGENPLNALITALWQLKVKSENDFKDENGETRHCECFERRLIWQAEPNGHTLKLAKLGNDLRIIINSFSDTDEYDGCNVLENIELILDVATDFGDFSRKVCREAICAVQKYGFWGYLRSWDSALNNADDFPISKIMFLMGAESHYGDNDLTHSDFNKEIKMLMSKE